MAIIFDVLCRWSFILHLLTLMTALGLVATILVLQYHPLPVPATYSLPLSQAITNFITAVVAIVLRWLFGACWSIANEVETELEYQTSLLSVARLQARIYIDASSIWNMMKLRFRVRHSSLLRLFLVFGTQILVVGGLSAVLSTIFVLQEHIIIPTLSVQSVGGQSVYTASNPASEKVVVSANVPSSADTCQISISDGNCTYDRSLAAASALLIARKTYTMAGVSINPNDQFNPSPRGIPWQAFQDFSVYAQSSSHPEEHSRICVPVTPRKSVWCEPDTTGVRASYQLQSTVNGFEVYIVTINPHTANADAHVRVAFRDDTPSKNDTMTIAQSMIPSESHITILTGSGAYAALLWNMTYGIAPGPRPGVFSTVCSISSASSWNWVEFQSQLGVINIVNTDQACSSGLEVNVTGITHLPEAIQGLTRNFVGIDGYTKLLNLDSANFTSAALQNMSLLESSLSLMYDIVQTTYTEIGYEAHLLAGSDKNSDGTNATTPVQVEFAAHNYIVVVEWSFITGLAFAVALILAVMTMVIFRRWYRAVAAIATRHALGYNPQDSRLLTLLGQWEYVVDETVGIKLNGIHQLPDIPRNGGPMLS